MKIQAPSVVFLALLACLIGIGLWWIARPGEPAPQTNAPTPKSPRIEVAAPAPTKPATKIAPPAQAKPASADTADTANTADTAPPEEANDPQADLKTAIPEMARLYRAGDIMTLVQTYVPPDKLTPEFLQMVQTMDQRRKLEDPAIRQDTDNSLAQIYEAFEDQTPTFNETGDEATFTTSLLPSKNGDPLPVHFVKINGKWYMAELRM